MSNRSLLFAFPLLALAACGGGGGTAGASPSPTPGTGTAVHVVLDTAGGTAALVQGQVVGVTLERGDGSRTDNLLDTPRNVTFSHPSGEAEGVELRHVPDGSYVAMHFAVAPGTGSAQMEDGSHHSVDFSSSDLSVPFEDNFAHGRTSESWLSVRHAGSSALVGSGTHHTWAPSLSGGGAADDSLGGVLLHVQSRDATGFNAHIPGDDHGTVHVEIENESELFDDHGGHHGGTHESWLSGVNVGDDIYVSGTIQQNGSIRGRRMRHEGNSSAARLIGRITAVNAGPRTFEMDVLATAVHGDRSLLQTPDHVTVTVGTAEIHFSRTQTQLTFGDLAVGGLVKVEPLSRTGSAVTAREIDVESRNGSPLFPETEGMVSAVDTTAGTITVVRRHSDPLLVNGQSVTSVTVHVGASTFLFRKERSGGGRAVIALSAVVPNSDRIWIRGTATSSTSVDADWVRVRSNN